MTKARNLGLKLHNFTDRTSVAASGKQMAKQLLSPDSGSSVPGAGKSADGGVDNFVNAGPGGSDDAPRKRRDIEFVIEAQNKCGIEYSARTGQIPAPAFLKLQSGPVRLGILPPAKIGQALPNNGAPGRAKRGKLQQIARGISERKLDEPGLKSQQRFPVIGRIGRTRCEI